jgi:tRNA nucleotidyltransferase (CCA-adding enzyme)
LKLTDLFESNEEIDFQDYINRLPPEIVEALKRARQNPRWHPEGSVYTHTKMVFDQAKHKGKDWAIAAIFHDLGKLDTESTNETGIHHYGHEKASVRYLDKYLHLFPFENKQFIYNLVSEHMRVAHYMEGEMKGKKAEEMAKHPHINELQDFHKMDINRKTKY